MPAIVAIGAHFDDVELRSGGTLARYAAEGWNVVYAVATTTPHYFPWPGEIASRTYRSNEEIVNLRKEESRRGASILGIPDVNFFDFKSLYWYREGTVDRRYFDGHNTTMEEFRYLNEHVPGREFIMTASHCPAAVDFLGDFLKEKKADIVLTHFPDDAHWEHYATASLVCTCVRRLDEAGRKMKLYAWEQGGAGNLTTSFAPSHFVDITGTIDLKCEALMSFTSQFEDHDPTMFAERARKKAREYGALAGMDYAEPFMLFQVPPVSHMDLHLAPTYSAVNARHGL
jgi:LmbE family N-acetylglucosaminyl deacetylase